MGADELRLNWIKDICRYARAAGVTNKILVQNRKRILGTWHLGLAASLPVRAMNDVYLFGDLLAMQFLSQEQRTTC